MSQVQWWIDEIFLFFSAAVVLSRPKLQTFLKYAKVELRPPSPSEWPEIRKGFQNLIQSAKTGRYRELTVKVFVTFDF